MALKNSTFGKERVFANEFKNRWDKFRDALRREDQLVFDEMFKAPVIHSEGIGSMIGGEFEKVVMAMLIEKRKIDNEFEEKLDDLKKGLTAIERKIQSAL